MLLLGISFCCIDSRRSLIYPRFGHLLSYCSQLLNSVNLASITPLRSLLPHPYPPDLLWVCYSMKLKQLVAALDSDTPLFDDLDNASVSHPEWDDGMESDGDSSDSDESMSEATGDGEMQELFHSRERGEENVAPGEEGFTVEAAMPLQGPFLLREEEGRGGRRQAAGLHAIEGLIAAGRAR